MKPIFIKGPIIFLCIMLFNLVAPFAEELICYELTQDKIKRIYVSQTPEGIYEVVVELNKPNRAALSQLTSNNIGKMVVITVSKRVLSRIKIMGKIDSGNILMGGLDSVGAVKIVEELINSNHKGDVGKNPQ